MSDEVKLEIDGKEVSVPKGTNLIKAAQKLGTEVPHFCYHPGLSVVGQCRMCFVEIEGMPKLATACSTIAGEGMKVSTQSEKVKAGQNGTLEFTLLNHPLDCPICDRGGECKLQDYTYEYGPPLSRMDEDKVLRDKHRPISEQIILDQERCILCTRCVRFSAEVDGKEELVVQNRGSGNVVDVFEDKPFSSAFSGNVVDICPVGALTAKDFRFAARPWELKVHEAVCTGCSMGCNVEIDTKHRHPGIDRPDGSTPSPKIVRLRPRENMAVNTWWMCDKGRWGYHFHNDFEQRIEEPMLGSGGNFNPASLKEIQAAVETQKGPWEFWIDDNTPHEGISWAKELLESWDARARSVKGINPSDLQSTFESFAKTHIASSAAFATPDWAQIKKVYSPISLEELEKTIPILKLRLDHKVKSGQVDFVEVKSASEIKSTEGTLVLHSAPESQEDFSKIEKSLGNFNMILWSQANSRGLVNQGIAPLETLAASLKGKSPSGPVFFFAQATQNPLPSEVVEYLSRAPFILVADSFKNPVAQKANALLPLTPLYEAPVSFTNVENIQQLSPGVRVHHPSYDIENRGDVLVRPSLRLI